MSKEDKKFNKLIESVTAALLKDNLVGNIRRGFTDSRRRTITNIIARNAAVRSFVTTIINASPSKVVREIVEFAISSGTPAMTQALTGFYNKARDILTERGSLKNRKYTKLSDKIKARVTPRRSEGFTPRPTAREEKKAVRNRLDGIMQRIKQLKREKLFEKAGGEGKFRKKIESTLALDKTRKERSKEIKKQLGKVIPIKDINSLISQFEDETGREMKEEILRERKEPESDKDDDEKKRQIISDEKRAERKAIAERKATSPSPTATAPSATPPPDGKTTRLGIREGLELPLDEDAKIILDEQKRIAEMIGEFKTPPANVLVTAAGQSIVLPNPDIGIVARPVVGVEGTEGVLVPGKIDLIDEMIADIKMPDVDELLERPGDAVFDPTDVAGGGGPPDDEPDGGDGDEKGGDEKKDGKRNPRDVAIVLAGLATVLGISLRTIRLLLGPDADRIEEHIAGYNFVGPGTRLTDRVEGRYEEVVPEKRRRGAEPYGIPINTLDEIALRHDMAYMFKNTFIRNEADRDFTESVEKLIDSTFSTKFSSFALKLKPKLLEALTSVEKSSTQLNPADEASFKDSRLIVDQTFNAYKELYNAQGYDVQFQGTVFTPSGKDVSGLRNTFESELGKLESLSSVSNTAKEVDTASPVDPIVETEANPATVSRIERLRNIINQVGEVPETTVSDPIFEAFKKLREPKTEDPVVAEETPVVEANTVLENFKKIRESRSAPEPAPAPVTTVSTDLIKEFSREKTLEKTVKIPEEPKILDKPEIPSRTLFRMLNTEDRLANFEWRRIMIRV